MCWSSTVWKHSLIICCKAVVLCKKVRMKGTSCICRGEGEICGSGVLDVIR